MAADNICYVLLCHYRLRSAYLQAILLNFCFDFMCNYVIMNYKHFYRLGGFIMSFKIITISREFGSGGRFIGEQIAQKCGIEFYDKKIFPAGAYSPWFATICSEIPSSFATCSIIFLS